MIYQITTPQGTDKFGGRAEDAFRAAPDTFRQLIDRSPFGIYVVDADFHIVQVSDGAKHVFEHVHPLIGRDLGEVLRILWPEPFASEAIAHFRHTLSTGESYHSPSTVERRADIDAREAYDWKLERITMPDGRPGVVCHFYDLTEHQRHEEHVDLLMCELNHRAKNLLTLVQAVARQTAAKTPRDFLERFDMRLQALAASQDLLVKSEWKSIPLEELVNAQLAHFGGLSEGRIAISGPQVRVMAAASESLGLALHELATNAAKYGSLSNRHGCVEIGWSVRSNVPSAPRFTMSWVEKDGPPVAKPTRRGFGSTVIGSMMRLALGCDADIDFAPTGLTWHIDCPADRVLDPAFGVPPPSNGACRHNTAI